MATATIISYPEALCMAGNMRPVRVSAAGLFTFRLKKGSTVLLEEDYVPDASGQAEIDIRDLVLSDLSLSLPSADVFKQTAAAASYTVSTDSDSRSFKAVLGGIDRPATDAATFLGANFLTWQPQLKSVTYGQPEWLSFYTPATAVSLKAKFYLKDGTTSTVTVAASFDPGCVYSVNVRFSRLWSMGEGDRYGMVDVWLEDDQGTALTYVQRYVLDTSGDERTVLVARNSLGGIDTFSFRGSMERAAEVEHTNVMRGETLCSGLLDLTRTYTVNTGILSRHECDWVWDLQRSPQAWALMDGALLPVVMLAPAVTASMFEDSTGTVDFYISDDSGYLNMPRMESLPEDIEVPGPDGEVFFLAPRLADYPDASLDDSLLLPVQSPAAQEWSKLSVAALSSYILSAVDDKYGEFLHMHDNLPVLGKLSVDGNGRLMYDGSPVGGSGLTEHDHHGETIRPEKIVVGTVEITCVDGRLHVSSTVTSDGDFVAYGDDEGGAAGGGLDVARLWEELKAEDDTKVIDVSHIPGSVVLQDELVEILDDYPLVTEMNTALAGKADKDWVETELDKYLLLTGGTITGDLTVQQKLTVGTVEITCVDGRLHISSTVTSDGDLVAFGDEEGSTGSGGLDVERLWQELGDSGSEQIAKGHLTDALSGYALKSEIPSLSGYATQDFVNNRLNDLIDGAPAAYDTLKEIAAALEDNEDSIGAILTTLGGKADKATTLAGYGITDAYTKTQIDEELAKYVTIAGNQDITGVKTFVNGIKIGSISLSVVDGRLHVSSTVTSDGDFVAFGDEDGASGSGGLDVARLWQELEADDPSKVIDVSHIPSITKAKISDFPTKWAWADISGKPTAYAPSAHLHAISDVTGLQGELNSKWVWSESQVKAVKVNSAASADNADTLDGVHANELLTALTSSETTNLSITVGGKSLSVTSLYSKYADQLRTAQKINGTSFNGAYDITTAKWGMARLVSIKDYTQDNTGAAKSVDGHESFSLLLPQSIKVKSLDVDGVTLSVVDGRLHISATATSAGDFVAYGDDEGGAGVLDVDKLWKELGGSVSSKVIAIEHIPSIPTSKITGLDNALASYATRTWVQQNFLASVPAATSSVLGGIKVGYADNSGGRGYCAVRLDSSGNAYVVAPSSADLIMWDYRTSLETKIDSMDEAIAGKAAASHEHPLSEISNLGSGWSDVLDRKLGERWGSLLNYQVPNWLEQENLPVNGYLPVNGDKGYWIATDAHWHYIEDIDDLGTGWAAALTAAKPSWLTSVPVATSSVLGGIKVGYTEISGDKYYAVRLNSSNHAYVYVPWTDTKYSLSSFGITATAAEINKLDGIGTLLHSGNYTSYTVTKTGGGASGTWPISINGNAATLGGHGLAEESNVASKIPYIRSDLVMEVGRYIDMHYASGDHNDYSVRISVPNVAGVIVTLPSVSGTLLNTGNYSSTLDSRYMRIGSSGYPSAYRKVFNLNGTAWSFLGTTTDAPTAYAPTTAGTSGYVLQSTGGTPKWTSRATLQHELLTAGAGCTSIPANADLNDYTTPGVYYCPYNATVATWSNSPTDNACSLTVLTAAGVIQILREYGYSSSAMEFTRRYYNGTWTSWVQTPRMSDVYTRTDADSRYVNASGDTMTGTLNINSSSEAFVNYKISGSNKAATGYLASQGAYLYSYPANKYLHITDAGSLLFGSSTVWHSGNDGSGSGLDADLLDGYHESSFLRSRSANNVDFNTLTSSGVYRLSYTTVNGASNGPSGCEWGNMLVLRGAGDTIAQLAFGYTSSARPKYRQGNPSNVGGTGSWSQWFTLATTLDNVYSASKLQTSRTIWGQSFNGTGNVSGAMSGVGSITGTTFRISDSSGQMLLYNNTSKNDKRLTLYPQSSYAAIYNINADGDTYYDLILGRNNATNSLYFDASAGNWGINTSSPAYKLDVAGEIRAISGITIGSTDDYGWYISTGTRISAGVDVARGVNVGSLLVSNAWADYAKVPTNGIYSKGDIWTGGKLYIPSTQGNNVFDAYIA